MSDSYPYSPELIAAQLFATEKRVLLFGASGIGKSTLAAQLATILARDGRLCTCIGADPGSPAFGVPGAVSLGRWQNDSWQLIDLEPLCTLDAGRFRLPLVSAVRHLAERLPPGHLLIDAPGIVRSVAGAELLTGLVEAAAINTVVVLTHEDNKLPLANELATIPCRVVRVQAAKNARLPGQRKRARQRTHLWNAYLHGAATKTVMVAETLLTGTPPPAAAERDWQGRQIAFLKGGRNLAIGEVLAVSKNIFEVRMVAIQETFDQVLVRDAYRNKQGRLTTFKPLGATTLRYMPPPDVTPYSGTEKSTGPRPVLRIGDATATLVNGVFGDPLLHLRFHLQKRSVLFDLGEGDRLPARLAHQVSDVFISHTHIDHISGFLWLMRSRIGNFQSCRLFGPPGLADHIASLMRGIHWDRIGEGGPQFEVLELHNDRLLGYALKAGKAGIEQHDERPAPGGLLLDNPDFKVWAVTLDHGAIPVLAYRLEQAPRLNVRKERLHARNLDPGAWLGELKRRVATNDLQTVIRLTDGSTATVDSLAAELLLITPARKLVYATDCTDSKTNREKLATLAHGAHSFFCEAAFLAAHREYAEKSGHLTTQGCGAIGQAAGVEQLVPFHFSRRYEKMPLRVYDEVRRFCPRIVLPQAADLVP
jgi:ribonuclease BN (tRNA processing enzyme)